MAVKKYTDIPLTEEYSKEINRSLDRAFINVLKENIEQDRKHFGKLLGKTQKEVYRIQRIISLLDSQIEEYEAAKERT